MSPSRWIEDPILKAGLDRQPLPGTAQTELTLPSHGNVRGSTYYH